VKGLAETEKVTVNLNVVDLGKIDLLVEQGFYSNRTDFIKSSIRSKISEHANIVDKVIAEKAFAIGVAYYTRKDLEAFLETGRTLNIKVVGMLVFAEDVDEELVRSTVSSVTVLGVLRATGKVRKVLEEMKRV
jgi:Arc/MetJ-type ribon-helix-helix transcriptional regulator